VILIYFYLIFINHHPSLFSGCKNKNMWLFCNQYAIIIIKNEDIFEWKFVHPIPLYHAIIFLAFQTLKTIQALVIS